MRKHSRAFMVLITLVSVTQWSASQFAFDFPQIFESVLIQEFGITAQQIGVLYTVSALPNLVINIFAALVIAKCGVALSALIFQSTVFIGVVLTYLGITQGHFYFVVAGRVFIGIAFDVTYLTQAIILEKWFSGSALSVAFGLGRSSCYIMKSLAVFVLPALYFRTRSLDASVMLISYYSVFIFLTTAIYVCLDFRYGDQGKKVANPHGGGGGGRSDGAQSDYKEQLMQLGESESAMDVEKPFEIRHLRYVKPKSWLIYVMAVIYIQMYYQFTNTATDLFMVRFGLSYEEAKNIISILPLVNALLIPVFSSIYGRFGNKPLGLFLSALLGCSGYLTMSLFPSKNTGYLPYLGVGMISIFFCMFAACLIPCLVMSFPKQAVGFVLATQATFLNVFSAGLPILLGFIYGPRTVQAYQNTLYALAAYCGVCAVLAFVHFLMDITGDRLLTMPENSRKVRKIQEKMSKDFVLSVLSLPKTENATLAPATLAAVTDKVWRSVIKSYISQGEDKSMAPNETKTSKVTRRVGQKSSGVRTEGYSKLLTEGTSQFSKTPVVRTKVSTTKTPKVRLNAVDE